MNEIRDTLLVFANQIIEGFFLLNTLTYLAIGEDNLKDSSESERLKENFRVLIDLVICRNHPHFRLTQDSLILLENDPVPHPFTPELFISSDFVPTDTELKILKGIPFKRVRISTPEVSRIKLSLSPATEGFIGMLNSRDNSNSKMSSSSKIYNSKMSGSADRYDIRTDSKYYSSTLQNNTDQMLIARTMPSSTKKNIDNVRLKSQNDNKFMTRTEQDFYNKTTTSSSDIKMNLSSMISGNKNLKNRILNQYNDDMFKQHLKQKIERLESDKIKQKITELAAIPLKQNAGFFNKNKNTRGDSTIDNRSYFNIQKSNTKTLSPLTKKPPLPPQIYHNTTNNILSYK